MKNTKIITVSLAAALAIGAITANGVLVSADAEKGTIKVAASATPHAEILEEAKPILEKEGWDLEVTVFDDYVQPNLVVESGDFDANYFQHIPYLDNFNEEQGTHLVNAGGIHYEPFGIYPGTKKSLDELEDGDTIAVPNDTTNEARALLLLQDNGVITLKDGAGLEATVKDIEENPKNIKIEELEAAQVSRVKDEVAFVVLNGNYALQAGYSVSKDSIAHETSDSEAAKTYVNVIAVKEGNEESEAIKALVDTLKSDEIKDFINEKYDGAVIPFDDSTDTEEADAEEEKGNYVVEEEPGKFRRIIASPMPIDIYEIDAVKALLDADQVVIAAGGGGIPVLQQGSHLKGASAIIEKDYVAARLAELIDADTLLFLTEGDKLVINADNDNRKEFDTVKADELKQYVNKNNLGEITTLPKVDAAVGFVLAGEGRKAVIANLEKAKEALAGKTGTTII